MTTERMQVQSAKYPPDLLRKIRAAARARGVTLGQWLREAAERQLKAERRKAAA